MSAWEGVTSAIGALLANKMRSFLTMLGIIIGVAAVIALVSLGQGSQASVASQMSQLGTNLITVNAMSYAKFEAADVQDMLDRIPTLSAASPDVVGSITAKIGDTTYDTRYEGVSESYPDIRNYTLAEGRFFDSSDVSGRKKVAVLGWTVYQNLISGKSAVGETVVFKGESFEVVGVLAQKGSSSGQSYDDRVFIPYTTALRVAGTRYFTTIMFQATSADDSAAAVTHLTTLLDAKFRTDTRTRDARQSWSPFRVMSQDELLTTMSTITGTFTALLSGIASVSLLVGGIGIMNIMLVSVTERTREIGIRKAIGAKKKDVLFQFLLEAVTVSALGGVIGIGTGIELAVLLGKIYNMTPVVSNGAIALSFTFSTLVGLFFGVYPASKAANLDPITALRYE
jgi:putative ABC transport system permease protein